MDHLPPDPGLHAVVSRGHERNRRSAGSGKKDLMLLMHLDLINDDIALQEEIVRSFLCQHTRDKIARLFTYPGVQSH